MSRDYLEVATEYAEQILSGLIPACQYVRQACQRFIGDLSREDFAYTIDPAKAHRACQFIELMPHIKGKWAGKAITLEPWQIFLIVNVFGWVDERGLRRFKTIYTEVPRKNAKSTLSSGVALYLLSADAEAGAEVYSAATTRDQARIVFADAKRMVERSEGLRRRFGVETSAHVIYVEDSASSFKALSRDQGGNLDGLNIHAAIVDELHAHKTRDVWDVIETATGAREQPLIWAITTAGFNRSGICYEQRSYVLKVLSGAVDDPEYFGIIYSIDDGDDWTDPGVWAKANPNWGVSVNPADIARKARKAMEMSSAQNNFLTKHLNVWVNADTAWMDMIKWDQCGDEALTLDRFKGQQCWIAFDLASKIDIAAVVILFRDGDAYTGFTRSYLAEETIENSSNSQYQGWAADGWIIETPGAITDFSYIEDDIKELAKRFDVQEVAYDPFQATYIATRLMEAGLPMVEYGQTVKNLSEPMKEWEALVIAENYRHDANPVQTWMVSNVVCHTDAKDNIFPRKEAPENKIDGPVATIMALGAAMSAEETTSGPGILII